MNLVPHKQLLLNVLFESTKIKKIELCVDNKVRETIGIIYHSYTTCENEKYGNLSTKKRLVLTTRKCKACCHVLNISFKDQKPTIMLFGGDGSHCFARKSSCDYEKEKPSPLSKKFLRQSQPSTSEPEPKNAEVFPLTAWSCRHLIGWNS